MVPYPMRRHWPVALATSSLLGAWSPDGKAIAFISSRDYGGQGTEVNLMDAVGGSQRRLTDTPKDEAVPRFSPDGRLLLFSSERDGAYQVYVMNPDGSGIRRITGR